MWNPFRRPKRILPDDLRDSAEDWHRGDVAVSVGDVGWARFSDGQPARGPEKGDMCRVTRVSIIEGLQFLCLAGYNPENSYYAANFKKLRGSTEEFEDQVKRGLPAGRDAAKRIERVREPELV